MKPKSGAAGTVKQKLTAATWPGNSAKARIIRLLCEQKRPITVFDYGAGSGGHWPDILPLIPNLTLVCFEPHAPSRAKLARRLSGLNAQVVDRLDGFGADVVVSFSVLEHVYDRPAYLRNARNVLKPGGTFYLSYDDGHFRNAIELARPRFGPLREHFGNLAAPILPKIGWISRYQRRVTREEADRLIEEASFTVVSERYDNLASLKRLSKAMTADRMGEFMQAWIEFEDQLNERFSFNGPKQFGDRNVLWQEMATRTLELK